MTTDATAIYPSPLGPIILRASTKGITTVRFARERSAPASPPKTDKDAPAPAAVRHLRKLAAQLDRYFAGRPVRFNVPLDLARATAFNQRVWTACAKIPSGATVSYSELAKLAGSPRGARAIGNAMHANPIVIVIPCHRVVRSDGSLGGYGAGLPRKRFLLKLERNRKR